MTTSGKTECYFMVGEEHPYFADSEHNILANPLLFAEVIQNEARQFNIQNVKRCLSGDPTIIGGPEDHVVSDVVKYALSGYYFRRPMLNIGLDDDGNDLVDDRPNYARSPVNLISTDSPKDATFIRSAYKFARDGGLLYFMTDTSTVAPFAERDDLVSRRLKIVAHAMLAEGYGMHSTLPTKEVVLDCYTRDMLNNMWSSVTSDATNEVFCELNRIALVENDWHLNSTVTTNFLNFLARSDPFNSRACCIVPDGTSKADALDLKCNKCAKEYLQSYTSVNADERLSGLILERFHRNMDAASLKRSQKPK
jgi:hypothetical protein